MDYWSIVRNSPAPEIVSGARYPINKLAVGESFTVPDGEEPRLRRAAANYNASHRDKKISVRRVQGGIWCGRLK